MYLLPLIETLGYMQRFLSRWPDQTFEQEKCVERGSSVISNNLLPK